MKKREVLEVLLDGIELPVVGGRKTARTHHSLLASLVWPRPCIAERVAVKPVDLVGGQARLVESGWAQCVLFKEVVKGRFGLQVGVSQPLTDVQMDAWLSLIGATAVKAAGRLVAEAMNGAAEQIAGLPLQFLGKQISGLPGKNAGLLGQGIVDLNSDDLGDGAVRIITVPLVAAEAVQEVQRVRRQGRLMSKRRTVLKAGATNGSIRLSLQLL